MDVLFAKCWMQRRVSDWSRVITWPRYWPLIGREGLERSFSKTKIIARQTYLIPTIEPELRHWTLHLTWHMTCKSTLRGMRVQSLLHYHHWNTDITNSRSSSRPKHHGVETNLETMYKNLPPPLFDSDNVFVNLFLNILIENFWVLILEIISHFYLSNCPVV